MASYYKTIKGVKYDRALLEEAEALATDGTISFSAAKKLWASACDGRGVTDIEKQTMSYVFKTYKHDKDAKTFFKISTEMVGDASKGYYKTVDGVKYDRSLLKEALAEVVKCKGTLDHDAVLRLWASAADGPGVTEIEARTLQAVCDGYPLSSEASECLVKKLATTAFAQPERDAAASEVQAASGQVAVVPTPLRQTDKAASGGAAEREEEAGNAPVQVKELAATAAELGGADAEMEESAAAEAEPGAVHAEEQPAAKQDNGDAKATTTPGAGEPAAKEYSADASAARPVEEEKPAVGQESIGPTGVPLAQETPAAVPVAPEVVPPMNTVSTHPKQTQAAQQAAATPQLTKVAAPAAAAPPTSLKRGNSEGDYCWDFKAGYCRRGNQCHWPHVGEHEDVEDLVEVVRAVAEAYNVTLGDDALRELATLPDTEASQLLDKFATGGEGQGMSEADRDMEVQGFCRRYRAEQARAANPGRWEEFQPSRKRYRGWWDVQSACSPGWNPAWSPAGSFWW